MDLRSMVSLLGGAVFMLLPSYLAIGANGHGSQVIAIAYMPLALLFTRKILKGPRRPSMAAFLAVVLGFQMLRGHIQISYYTYLLVGILFVYEAVHRLRSGEGRTAFVNGLYIAGACIAAAGIAAVLVLPVREYAAYSIRGGAGGGGLDYGYATGWSLHPKEMLTFLFPWAYGFGKASYWGEMPFTDYPNYIGVPTFVFSVIALFYVENRWKWFFILIAAIATILSFGRFFPILYGPMFRFFPYFNRFRVPVMILIVQQLAFISLMGLGLEEFLRRNEKGNLPSALSAKGMKWVLVAGAVALIVTLVAARSIRESLVRDIVSTQKVSRGWVEFAAGTAASDLSMRILLYVATAFVLFFASSKRMLSNTLVVLVALIALVDIWTVDRPVVHPERTWRADEQRIIRANEEKEEFMQADPAVDFLRSDTSYFRILPVPAAPVGRWSYSTQPFSENRFMIFRLFSLGGYHAAKLRNYQDIIEVMFGSFNEGVVPINILNMLNAKYIVSYFPLFDENSIFPLVWGDENVFIYENLKAMPRVTLLGRYRVLPRERVIDKLVSLEFDPSEEVILEREPVIAPVTAEGSSAEIIDYGLNGITLRAHIEEPCIMLFSEIDYPSWKASVDGMRTEILTADYCLRAIPLAAGDHEIVFRFSSDILRISLIISIVTFAFTLAVPIIERLSTSQKG
jgi:ABC-type multidrug transport system fused ATPase/permease subunit